MQTSVKNDSQNNGQWYLRYLPFIAKPQHLQVLWLVAECEKKKLSNDELLPYVRLLFATDNEEDRYRLQKSLALLDDAIIYTLLEVADIYIVARIIDLIPPLNSQLAEVVLVKEMPPYEQKPQKIMDDVFYAINNCVGDMLADVATLLIKEKRVPAGFQENYERFRLILEDEEFIRTQWPSSR